MSFFVWKFLLILIVKLSEDKNAYIVVGEERSVCSSAS